MNVLAKITRTSLEDAFLKSLEWLKVEAPVREYRFDNTRRWRFDFCWIDKKIAAEVAGGTWTFGGHSRGKGYESDCRKENAALLQGWRVFRFTTDMVHSLEAASVIEEALRSL